MRFKPQAFNVRNAFSMLLDDPYSSYSPDPTKPFTITREPGKCRRRLTYTDLEGGVNVDIIAFDKKTGHGRFVELSLGTDAAWTNNDEDDMLIRFLGRSPIIGHYTYAFPCCTVVTTSPLWPLS